MNNCKNCKYFYRHHNFMWDKYGDCVNKKIAYGESNHRGYLQCLDNRWTEKIKDTDMVLYMDGESYSAELEVGEDFGCIHFEEKEK